MKTGINSELVFTDKKYFVKAHTKYLDFEDYTFQLEDFLLLFLFHHKSIVSRHSRIFLNRQTNEKQPNA
jgi:hypothetical protein